ncbi:MAG TPA: ATP-binding protein [Labilithrix sp.]|nr:ATP-binding protein [Labilithrix sp.]
MHGVDENPYIELCFRPTIATINEARRLVAAIYQPLLGDADAAGRVALTTHELLENALKYSVDGSTVIRVEVSRCHPGNVKIETRNEISPERKAGLEEAFEEMQRAASAEAFYQFAMQRTRTLRHGSGLGLARIWAEGEMQISRSYIGDEVRITAVATLPEVK